MELNKDLEFQRTAILKVLNKRYRRTPIEVFEEYISNIAEFILIIILIPFLPFIIWASRSKKC